MVVERAQQCWEGLLFDSCGFFFVGSWKLRLCSVPSPSPVKLTVPCTSQRSWARVQLTSSPKLGKKVTYWLQMWISRDSCCAPHPHSSHMLNWSLSYPVGLEGPWSCSYLKYLEALNFAWDHRVGICSLETWCLFSPLCTFITYPLSELWWPWSLVCMRTSSLQDSLKETKLNYSMK